MSALLAAVPNVPAPPVEITAWLAFSGAVVVLLVLDLFVFHRGARDSSLTEAVGWTAFWAALALAFNAFIWWWRGPASAIEFLSGYLIEWSLSMDNVFVFAVIFTYFAVPKKYQYRVLFWGILGAILMRLAFVLLGSALIHRFDWMLPVFGVFLTYTGVKLATKGDEEVHPDQNPLLRLARKLFRVARGDHGAKFFVREEGKLAVTPLFLVLIVVESTDVVFAVDSVPAIFGVTRDPFIVFTSNICAILGLRALYFLLAGVMDLFRYLKYGLSGVLVFVGLKMTGDYLLHTRLVPAGWRLQEGQHLVPSAVSLVIVFGILAVSIAASLWVARREAKSAPLPAPKDDEPQPADGAPAAH